MLKIIKILNVLPHSKSSLFQLKSRCSRKSRGVLNVGDHLKFSTRSRDLNSLTRISWMSVMKGNRHVGGNNFISVGYDTKNV